MNPVLGCDMDTRVDFSIVIPAKNEEKNIKNCLDSIFKNNFEKSRYEVLVIDNGSEDKTVQIVKTMGAQVFVKPECTISCLRNFGAMKAKGIIIAFLDADCTVSDNWLYAASMYISKDEIVSFGSPAVLPKDSTWVQREWFNIRGKKNKVEDVDWLESANVFVRADAFRAAGGFKENLVTCEDYDLSVRLKRFGRIVADSRIVAVHHREPATIREFFYKEKWRGRSNLTGGLSHGFCLKEIPSLLIPFVYLFLMVVFVIYFILALFNFAKMNWVGLGIFLLLWQFPILILALWKISRPNKINSVLKLYLLLNIYFLARGCAVFGGGRR